MGNERARRRTRSLGAMFEFGVAFDGEAIDDGDDEPDALP